MKFLIYLEPQTLSFSKSDCNWLSGNVIQEVSLGISYSFSLTSKSAYTEWSNYMTSEVAGKCCDWYITSSRLGFHICHFWALELASAWKRAGYQYFGSMPFNRLIK